MLPASSHASIAERLVRARRDGTPIPAEDLRSTAIDETDAYAIQAAVCGRIGSVGAWKTARKTPDAVPIMAPILSDMVRQSPASFRRDELRLIGIEVEVAFRVDAALPHPDDADFESLAAERVSALTAIEVVDSRLADFEAAGPFWKLADNQINGGFVVGDPVPDWQALDVTTVAAELTIDGQTLVAGRAAVPGGSAFGTFCAFARHVGNHCGGLRPGQFVTTGSVTGLRFIEAGSNVVGRIEGLGAVTVSFEAT